MRKGLIIALAVVLVLGLSGAALAWETHFTGDVNDGGVGGASGTISAHGWVSGCDLDGCESCPWTLEYDFQSTATIVDTVGRSRSFINGSGGVGDGWMDTEVRGQPAGSEANAAGLFASQKVEAYVCQPCCEIDYYKATTQVNVEDGSAYIKEQQVTGLPSLAGIVDPCATDVTEQTLVTYGTAGNDLDGDGLSLLVRMDAEKWVKDCMSPSCQFNFVEDHTMGIIGESVEFDVYAYQGMASECSNLYGALGCVEEILINCEPFEIFCPIMQYGKFDTCDVCD